MFVILDLLCVTLLWMIELKVNGNISFLGKEGVPSDCDSFYVDAYFFWLCVAKKFVCVETWFLDFKVLP